MADRLISAEMLLEVMDINFCDGCDGSKYGRCSTYCMVNRLKSFIRLADGVKQIDSAPPVEAEPVKHGHWIDIGFLACKCSVCDEPVYENGGTAYCPNCGARMDGGENDI